MLKHALAGVAFATIAISGSASWAGPLEYGVDAYIDGNFEGALGAWLPLAEQGDRLAQFNVGLIYEHGRGVDRDPAQAMDWYRRAAEGGDVISQFKLGLLYAEGRGVSQNYDEAAKWYLIAAENNHVRAQFSIGTLYANGQGVPQSAGTAFEWYERAENTSCTFGDVAVIDTPRFE